MLYQEDDISKMAVIKSNDTLGRKVGRRQLLNIFFSV